MAFAMIGASKVRQHMNAKNEIVKSSCLTLASHGGTLAPAIVFCILCRRTFHLRPDNWNRAAGCHCFDISLAMRHVAAEETVSVL